MKKIMTAEEWVVWLEKQMVENTECGMEWTPGHLVANIFDITTYDDAADRVFAEHIVEVLTAIATRTTFEYQAQSTEHYYRFLTVINFKNIYPMLEWGTSIRGCWFNLGFGKKFDPVDYLTRFQDQVYPVIESQEEMAEFVKALRTYLDTHPETEDKE
ncbi:hypothetical protein pEaSNUABM37_00073 [Erwinia phage pEa_SNUABM_37]|nr:hypothetical protein pEaSNUABM37_00073 [Erwinia phage pEa_SNUABM_37]QXO10543.1 hypothetical protein pEaSNUABM48_00073 [Erwinia phage pEa_SNUABM_48]